MATVHTERKGTIGVHLSLDPAMLAKHLAALGSICVTKETVGSLSGLVSNVELGFYHYPYSLLEPIESFRGFSVASWKDILCMKMTAVGSRAAKRDYVDIYFGLKAGLSLRQLLDLVKRKFGAVEYSEYHLVRSLIYFDEVEDEPMPEMLQSIEWPQVRSFLHAEVRRLSNA